MMGKKKITLELFISSIALIVAAFAAYATYFSVRQSGQIAKFQAFLMLRSEYGEIEKTFPPGYREEGVDYPVGSKEWQSLCSYWYHALNDWAITTRFGHRDFKDLWTMFYRDAICIALEKDSMRAVFNYLKNNRFKSGLQRQFVVEVEAAKLRGAR